MTTPAKELYKFVLNGVTNYTVTSSDTEEVYDGDTYAPIAIGRTETESKGDMARQSITVTMSIDNITAQEWFISSQDFPIVLTIYSKDEGTVSVEWKGRLSSAAPKGANFEFTFESIFTSMRRTGLRQKYQISCPYALYSTGCTVDMNSFADAGTVTNVTNNVVTVTEAALQPDGFYSGGIFKDNAGNLRFISDHTGTQITLIRALTPLIDYVAANGYTGLTCTLYPGCNRTKEMCNDRFSNLANYGGFPYLPTKNPFGGTPIA